ncbi:type II secretion system protein GspL [Vibrio sp. SCSIO 43136]|uniref:type II secretion system protein GspL n=1 Tax=Vibrio sp. SCSIO 43136 TaxID=2819101 RepID=UPI0020765B05|nr:type II secretion system protein GspL [Vibrio sp. SCSIO 43136]USD65181.1 type II secretion system protein GspL [Vibrio sp. SCSIO 43136]
MSEFLTVRLNSEPNEPIMWAVWSTSQQEVIASGELMSEEDFSALSDYAQQRQTLLLLPTDKVLMREVEIPAGASRQFETMLPYLVEDDVAEDVDDLHFHVLSKASGKAWISAVNRSYFASVLESLAQANITPLRVMPDTLAMPWQPNSVSAIGLGQQWLFRDQQHHGFAVQENWLPLVDIVAEQESASEEAPSVVINSYTPIPESKAQSWQLAPAELPMALLSQGAIASKVNLLSGEFKPSSSWLKYWKVWRKVAVAAVLLVSVLGAKTWLEVNKAEQTAAQYRAESERIFRQVFPDKRKIPTVSYLKRQMQQEEQRLSGGSQGDDVMQWLAKLPLALEQSKGMQVQSVKYDSARGEVRLQVSSSDFQTFEAVRVELEALFDVEQGQLNRNGEQVFGSYVIRRKS